MKLKPLLFSTIIFLFTASCGEKSTREDDGPVNNTTPVDSTKNEIISDAALGSEAIASQVDEAVSQIATNADVPSVATLALTGNTYSRICTPNSGSPKVEILRDHTFEIERERRLYRFVNSISDHVSIHRTWSKPDSVLACNTAGTQVNLSGLVFTGLTLDVLISRERTHTSTIINKNTQERLKRIRTHSVEGERHVVWSDETSTAELLTRQSRITSDVKRTMTLPDRNNNLKNLTMHTVVASDAPLVVSTVRNNAVATKDWISRTIVSGTTTARFSDATKVEVTFTDVKFTAEKKCLPESGTIDGKLYDSDTATKATSTYTIVFASDSASIKFVKDGAETVETFTLDGCDLETDAQALDVL